MIEKAGCNPTFKELDKKLYVSSMCVNTSSTVYFSRDTHPDMHVIDAVCASMSIPFMFAGFRYQDGLYLDGGTLEEIPALPFLHKNGDDVFAIQMRVQRPVFESVPDIKDYIKKIITAGFLTRLSYPQIKRTYLPCDVNILDWKLTVEDKLRLFISGQS
jgi:predicted acylesterase/phospholipase RssA